MIIYFAQINSTIIMIIIDFHWNPPYDNISIFLCDLCRNLMFLFRSIGFHRIIIIKFALLIFYSYRQFSPNVQCFHIVTKHFQLICIFICAGFISFISRILSRNVVEGINHYYLAFP